MLKNKTLCLMWVRGALCLLIVLNMAVIYYFSAQNGKESSETSGRVTQAVATVVVEDFAIKSEQEQQAIVEEMHPPVRKIAHMAEFGTLGLLVFLLLLTWRGNSYIKYGISLLYTFLYACTDELHQILSESRGPQFSDVLIDTAGALLLCTLALAISLLVQHYRRKKENEGNNISTEKRVA